MDRQSLLQKSEKLNQSRAEQSIFVGTGALLFVISKIVCFPYRNQV
jgi:hypothetical protein